MVLALVTEKDDVIDAIINPWPVCCKVCSLFCSNCALVG